MKNFLLKKGSKERKFRLASEINEALNYEKGLIRKKRTVVNVDNQSMHSQMVGTGYRVSKLAGSLRSKYEGREFAPSELRSPVKPGSLNNNSFDDSLSIPRLNANSELSNKYLSN